MVVDGRLVVGVDGSGVVIVRILSVAIVVFTVVVAVEVGFVVVRVTVVGGSAVSFVVVRVTVIGGSEVVILSVVVVAVVRSVGLGVAVVCGIQEVVPLLSVHCLHDFWQFLIIHVGLTVHSPLTAQSSHFLSGCLFEHPAIVKDEEWKWNVRTRKIVN